MRNRKIYRYQPIEIEILHNYNQNISIQYEEPYNTVIGDNRIAISRLRNVEELPLSIIRKLFQAHVNVLEVHWLFKIDSTSTFSITYFLYAIVRYP